MAGRVMTRECKNNWQRVCELNSNNTLFMMIVPQINFQDIYYAMYKKNLCILYGGGL